MNARTVVGVWMFFGFAVGASAADVSVQLDSTDGSSRFVVQNSQTGQIFRVNSSGVSVFSNEVQILRPINGASGWRSALLLGGGEDIQIGEGANGYMMGTAVGPYTEAYSLGAALGHSAGASSHGAALGNTANAKEYGVAVGNETVGTNYGVAVGAAALGSDYGVGIGHMADGGDGGVAIGYQAKGFSAVAVGRESDATANGTALGYQARATNNGVAVGLGAQAHNQGAAVGRAALAVLDGSALGYLAKARELSVAVGWRADGQTNSVAMGHSATGRFSSVAIGSSSLSLTGGVAVGSSADAQRYGIAIGNSAIARGVNIAIGLGAINNGGSNRIAIGTGVTNIADNSTHIRGSLFVDGGVIWTRNSFGSGTFTTAKAFTIPHPLDPDNQVLRHFCVEGPEVWNVYAGNAQLVDGQAVIPLPDYYCALNKAGSEVCSLTPWGAAAVWAVGVERNQLRIAGDRDVKVSWEIKVLRNDPALQEDLKNRPVEQLRSELAPGQIEAENQTVNTGP